MGRVAKYVSGDHWVECPVCGFTYRNSQMRMRWDGQSVCPPDWEPRQPQDFVRAVEEDTAPKGHVRPTPDILLGANDIGDENVTLSAGVGIPHHFFGSQITADRTITLSTTDVEAEQQIRIESKILQPFNIIIDSIRTIPPRTGFSILVEFDGADWFQKDITTT